MIPASIYMLIPFPVRRYQFELADDLRSLREDVGDALRQFTLRRRHRIDIRVIPETERPNRYADRIVECRCGNYTVTEMGDSAAERRAHDHRRDVGISW